jgi:hypothetical protein
MVCLDEMGPESAKSLPGQELVRTEPEPQTHGWSQAGRAKQKVGYVRRGKRYIFGAFRPATSEAFSRPYGGYGNDSRQNGPLSLRILHIARGSEFAFSLIMRTR